MPLGYLHVGMGGGEKMLKCVPWRKIANVTLAVLFVGLAASLAMPAVYEICSPNEYTHAKECTLYHLPQFIFIGAVGIGDAHNGLIIAVATALLTWITWRLAILESAGAKTTEAQLRARILVFEPVISINAAIIDAAVNMNNFGPTPAKDVTVWIQATISWATSLPAPFPQRPVLPNIDVSSGPMAPGVPLHCIATIPSSQQILDDIIAGQRVVIIHGNVDYFDIFDRPQHLDYRLRAMRNSAGAWVLFTTEQGNKST